MTSVGDVQISIIIPVYNKIELTEKCIEQIYSNTDSSINYEIVIVDNDSQDNTAEVITELISQHRNLNYLKLNKNYGFGKACNQGASFAKGKYLMFLNNDTEPQPGWLKHAMSRLTSDPEIGIVGSRLLYPDGTVQHCGIEMYKDVNPDYPYWPLHRFLGADADDPRTLKAEDVVAVTGACLLISKELFWEVDGFDENYEMYFEDLDLNFKIRRKGLKIFYEPASVVIHHEGKSTCDQDIIDRMNAKSAKLFFTKWKKELYHFHLREHIVETDGKFYIVSEKIYPENLINGSLHHKKDEAVDEYLQFFEKINSIGSAYIHFGGAGDALLLLSTFYDDDPGQTIISFANSVSALKSFFSAFNKLKKVYIIPLPPNALIHESMRKLLPRLKNIKGMGTTPTISYLEEWNEDINIFKKYGVNKHPNWINEFKGERNGKPRVVLAPKGSMVGMVGSKKNIISTKNWKFILKFLLKHNLTPIIIGTPDEREDYPSLDGCLDERSYSFEGQMKIINSSDIFIGADSWGKTMAALVGIPTIVFKPIVGEDLAGWKDNSDYIFIDPWDDIRLVDSFQEFKKTFEKIYNNLINVDNGHIIIEGPLLKGNSLAHVNMELASQFEANNYQLSLLPRRNYSNDSFQEVHYSELKKLIDRKMKGVDIHITHQWPPVLTPPKEGKWVVIQPWEFGSLPVEWVSIYCKYVDEVWVPSNYVKQVCVDSGIPDGRVAVIPNGFNPNIFYKNENTYPLKTKKKFKFLFVGGTIYRKGIDNLLKAYLNAFNVDDDVCLVIKDIGQNSVYQNVNFRNEILKLVDLDNIPEVEYIDRNMELDELNRLYNSCNVLVHPYRGEGFGLPILEAMACGLPTIVTNGGPALDFCTEETSLFVDAYKKQFNEKAVGELTTIDYPWMYEPSIKDLTQKLQYAFENQHEMAEKGEAALLLSHENWSWEQSYKKANERIQKLIWRKKTKRFDGPIAEIDIYDKRVDESKFTPGEVDTKLYDDLIDAVQILIDLGKFDDAENALLKMKSAFDLLPKDENYNQLNASYECMNGFVAFGRNDIQSAKEKFENALNTFPSSSEACRGLAEIFKINEMFSEAKVMFEWALKNDPNNQKAADGLSEINIAMGLNKAHFSLDSNE